jgi:hypothetical protein
VTAEWGWPVSGTGEKQHGHHEVGPHGGELLGRALEIRPNSDDYSFSFYNFWSIPKFKSKHEFQNFNLNATSKISA